MDKFENFRKVINLVNGGAKGLWAASKDLGKSIKSVVKPEIELNKTYVEKRTLNRVVPYDIYYQGDIAWVKYHDLDNGSQEEIELTNFISCFKQKI